MKHQSTPRFTELATHSIAYTDCHSALRTCPAKVTFNARTEYDRNIRKIRPPVLEQRNQWQIKLPCNSSRLYVPPTVSDSEENVRLKRVNQVVDYFPRRQNRKETFHASRERLETKFPQLADNFQTKRKSLPRYDLRLNPSV